MLKENSIIELNNIYISKKENKYLIVSIDFGTWQIISKETMNIIDVIRRNNRWDYIKNSCCLDDKTILDRIKQLYSNGIIRIDDKNRINKIDIKSVVLEQNPTPQLCILHVSNICNLECKYCYAHTDDSKKSTMSLEVMLKSIEKFMKLPTDRLTIEFHGGEPLLRYKEITAACKYAVELGKKVGKKITFAMQSNMTYINDEIIKMIKQYNIKIRISLDGHKEINDYYRINNKGKGTYDTIINNIDRLHSNNIFPEVVTVVTKRNVDKLQEIFQLYSSKKLNKVRLVPFWSQGMGKTIDEDMVDNEYLAQKYIELIDWIVKHNRKACDKEHYMKMLVLSKEIETLFTLRRTFMCLRCPCGAGINMIDISIDGDIYPCEEMNEIEPFKIGNIEKDSIMDAISRSKVVDKLKNRNPNHIEECKTCPWKRHCQSGCANKNYQKYGEVETKSEKCDFYKRYFEDLIWYLFDNKDAINYLV